ncbi:jg25137 [Pararge aegeria aegeria]|uniref:Jg25137 protein n=1 Tax=Pararge aegeria aegeria TaxID=348720 RepID=A0A8S4SFR1_9NEOP|nr:jg25137 [Pararge aegeria aegeria]
MMVIDRAKNNSPEIFQIANCEVVQSFVYLGALITNNGGCVEEVKRRMAITRTTMEKLKKIWRNITKATKIRFVQTLVFPIFLYAAETLTLREVEKRKIDALGMLCWRRMLGVSWNEFRTNISIIRGLDIKQRLSTLVHSRILKFFGHVSGRDNNSIDRHVVQGKVEGARSMSPMQWTDQIKSSEGDPLHE